MNPTEREHAAARKQAKETKATEQAAVTAKLRYNLALYSTSWGNSIV